MTSPVKPYSYDEGVARLGYDPIKEFDDVFPLKKPTASAKRKCASQRLDAPGGSGTKTHIFAKSLYMTDALTNH